MTKVGCLNVVVAINRVSHLTALFQVVFPDGIFVRSSATIKDDRVVRIAPCGTVLKATGKVRNSDNIHRFLSLLGAV